MSALTILVQFLGAGLELPAPSGPHAVGTRLFHWIDYARAEPGTADDADPRELMVQVWYPADVPARSAPAPYVLLAESHRAGGLFDERELQEVQALRAHAVLDAPVAAAAGSLPIVVFSTGNGEHAFAYTTLAEELASHGLLFAVLSPPGVADVVFPDGRVLRRYPALYDPKPAGWEARLDAKASLALRRAVYDGFYDEAAAVLAGDVSFVLDELARLSGEAGEPFAGRLDLARVATFGHSYGGNVAVEAAARDARVKACLSWDGGAFGPVRERGLAKPFLLFRPAFVNEGTPRGLAQTQLLGSLLADGFALELAGAEHRSCMDAFLAAREAEPALPSARALEITSACARAFLARTLDGASSTALAERAASFPEVSLRVLDFPEERQAALREGLARAAHSEPK